MGQGLNKNKRIDLSVARIGQGELDELSGRYIKVIATSGSDVEFQVALRGDFNTTYYRMIDQAHVLERQGFTGIYITNEAQSNAWAEVVITDGPEDFDYVRPISNNIENITNPVKTQGGNTLENDAVEVDTTVGGTLILAADNATTGFIVLNTHATSTLYLGAQGLDATDGYPVAAGTNFGWDGTFDLYGLSSAGAIDVRVLKCSQV